MTSGAADTEASAITGTRDSAAAPAGPGSVGTAVVLATAPATGRDRPAALLPWDGGTVLGRLLGQLGSLGVSDVRILTRPDWLQAVSEAVAAPVKVSRSPAEDVREIASLARSAGGGMVILPGEIVTHGSALAGLLKDPRVTTGILTGGGVYPARQPSFRVRAKRGRVMSAASPYHTVHKPTGSFLGVLKIDAADRQRLASAADRLAELVDAPPAGWLQELARKEETWRLSAWRAADRAPEDESDEEAPEGLDDEAFDDEDPDTAPAAESILLSEADEERLADRVAAAPDDVASLLLVGLVRDRTHVGVSRLRRLFWARPLSPAAIDAARERIGDYDEDKVLLDSAVKASDGFFTTFFVSTYSRYIARWAAHRGFTPNQVTTVSLFIGILAAAAFATGERWGLVAGAILLQAAFTTDCVDGQLARYTRTFSKLGAWLDSIFDRSKEYVCFAGLAIGASATGDPVWTLACAAIILQTARHFSDFSFGAGQTRLIGDIEQPPVERALDAAAIAAAERRAAAANAPSGPRVSPPREPGPLGRRSPRSPAREPGPLGQRAPLSRRVLRAWHTIDRLPGVRWLKRMAAFPIGERFAAISLTAALFDARVTFIVLLSWGGFAVLYTLSGRVLRSIAR